MAPEPDPHAGQTRKAARRNCRIRLGICQLLIATGQSLFLNHSADRTFFLIRHIIPDRDRKYVITRK